MDCNNFAHLASTFKQFFESIRGTLLHHDDHVYTTESDLNRTFEYREDASNCGWLMSRPFEVKLFFKKIYSLSLARTPREAQMAKLRCHLHRIFVQKGRYLTARSWFR